MSVIAFFGLNSQLQENSAAAIKERLAIRNLFEIQNVKFNRELKAPTNFNIATRIVETALGVTSLFRRVINLLGLS